MKRHVMRSKKQPDVQSVWPLENVDWTLTGTFHLLKLKLKSLKNRLCLHVNWVNLYFYMKEMLTSKWWKSFRDLQKDYPPVLSTASLGPESRLKNIYSWVVTLASLGICGKTSQKMVSGRSWWRLMLPSCIPTLGPASCHNISKIVSLKDLSLFSKDTAHFREMNPAHSQSLLR